MHIKRLLTMGLCFLLFLCYEIDAKGSGGHGGGASSGSGGGTVHVNGYYRSDGTYVHSYDRAAPGQGTSSLSSTLSSQESSRPLLSSSGVSLLPTATEQIEDLIQRYGKWPIINFIRARTDGFLTWSVGTFRRFYHAPHESLVTARTLSVDLATLGIPPSALAKHLQAQHAGGQAGREAEDREAGDQDSTAPQPNGSTPLPAERHEARLPQIEHLIAQYNSTYPITDLIRAKKDGFITLLVGNTYRTFYGAPDPAYVTPQTILWDLNALGIDVNTLAQAVEPYAEKRNQWLVQRQQKAIELQRQQAEAQRQQEEAAQTEAKAKADAEARAQAEAEARAHQEREAASRLVLPQKQDVPPSQVIQPGNKETLASWEAACRGFGVTAKEAAKAKDRGATYGEMVTAVRQYIRNQPNPLYRNISETIYGTMIKGLYQSRWSSPERFQQEMEFTCIQGVSQGLQP